MLCRMPVVSLPVDLREQLENSTSGTINGIQGPGVAVYVSPDGSARADIYFGLKLDGYDVTRNISDHYPQIKMQFAVQPRISCQSNISFNPNTDRPITIQVICSETVEIPLCC